MIKTISALLALSLLTFTAQAANRDFCLLTDMSLDVDDLGALQLALYYHHTNEINLRCVIVGTSRSGAHRPIKHMINWWGYDTNEIRVGNNKNGNGNGFGNDRAWVNPYINHYKVPDFNPENGATLLNEMLAKYPDLHVVEVGPAVTVFNAKARPKNYYQMGGRVPAGSEFNLDRFPVGANYIESIQGTTFFDWNLGAKVTGQASVFTGESPVKFGYNTYTGGRGRFSWDGFTVIGAVTGDRFFTYRTGTMLINSNGSNAWTSGSRHKLAVHKNSAKLINYMNSILNLKPVDVESKRENSIVPILNFWHF